MTDLDPEIWNNPTLGAAAQNENLDRLTKQQLEDRAAKLEGRDPREVIHDNNHPAYTPPVNERTGTTPSNFQALHYADEAQNDIPVESGPFDETAGAISVVETDGDSSDESESVADSSTKESTPTPWS